MKIRKKAYKYLDYDFDVENFGDIKDEFLRISKFDISSTNDLEKLIYWSNELLDEVEYKSTQLYIELSTNTSSSELMLKDKKYKEEILFRSKSYFHELEKKIVDSQYLKLLDPKFDHYKVILKKNIRLYNEDNISLKEKEDELCIQYRTIVSNVTVRYNDKLYTKAQAQKLLNTCSSEDKKSVWLTINNAWLNNKKNLDKLFNQILEIRQEIALNCGFKNYGEYLHLSHSRFNYELDELKVLHSSVEDLLVPLFKEKVTHSIFPWETNTFNKNIHLKPFETTEELIEGTRKIISNIDTDFLRIFDDIIENDNMDLEARKGKTTGGFCFPIDRNGSPFICMNVAGRPEEISILIHEIMHGIHSTYNSKQEIRACRMFSSNGELAEFPTMSLELFALDHYNEFYDSDSDIKTAQNEHYIKVLSSLIRYVTIDAFEQWIYANPNHTVTERDNFYSNLVDKFNINTDWQGFEIFKSLEWYKSQLIVIMPFYIVSYAVAQIAALKIFKNYRDNKEKTIKELKLMLELGFSKPIDELYNIAGINFNFNKESLESVIKYISTELGK